MATRKPSFDDDDDIDFNSLQNELDAAVAKDKRYQSQNDAKFRAINQKVGTYDEFRNIVEASHLTPLDKSDKIGGISYQKWNYGCNATAADKQQSEGVSKQPQFKLNYFPRSYQEFLVNWRKLEKSANRFEYLGVLI